MKSDNPWRHFLLAFLMALGIYAVFYQGIEHRRNRKGPWQVTFTNNAAGAPAILIIQPRLGIENVEVAFPGEEMVAPNPSAAAPGANDRPPITLIFREPRPVPYPVPFGKCVFMDTTFLPGTVTFQLFGHEIELLPRVLIIDRAEHQWLSHSSLTLRRGQE